MKKTCSLLILSLLSLLVWSQSLAQPHWIAFSGNPLEDSVRNAANQLPLFEWTEDSSHTQPLGRVAYRIWGYADWQMSRFDFPQQFLNDTAVAYPVIREQIPMLHQVYRYAFAQKDTQTYFLAAGTLVRAYAFIVDQKNYNKWVKISNHILKDNLVLTKSDSAINNLKLSLSEQLSFYQGFYKYNLKVKKSSTIRNYYKHVLHASYSIYAVGIKPNTIVPLIDRISSISASTGTPLTWYEFVAHLGSVLRYNKQVLDSLSLYQKSIDNIPSQIPDALDARLLLAAVQAQGYVLSGNTGKALEILENSKKIKNRLLEIISTDTLFVSAKLITALLSCAEAYGYLGDAHAQEAYGQIAFDLTQRIYQNSSAPPNMQAIQYMLRLFVMGLANRQVGYGKTSQGQYRDANNIYIEGIKSFNNSLSTFNKKGKGLLANLLNTRIQTEVNQNYYELISLHASKFKKHSYSDSIWNKITTNNPDYWRSRSGMEYKGRLYYYKALYYKEWFLHENKFFYIDSAKKAISIALASHISFDKDFKHIILNEAGDIYAQAGQADSAIRYFNEAIALSTELYNQPQTAKYCLSLAALYLSAASPDVGKALSLIQQAEPILPLLMLSDRAEALRYHTLRGQVYAALGDVRRGIATSNEGIALYLNTIAYTSLQDREIWAGQLQRLHPQLVDLQAENGDVAGLFYTAELIKGRMLQTAQEMGPKEDALLRIHHPDWLAARDSLRVQFQYQSFKLQSATLSKADRRANESRLNALKATQDSLQREIAESLPGLAAYKPYPDSLAVVQAALADGESLVEYVAGRDRLYAVVIPARQSGQQPRAIALAPLDSLRKLMKIYVRNIHQFDPEVIKNDSTNKVLQQLYCAIWQPLQASVSEQVVLVTDPVLSGLSFASLLDTCQLPEQATYPTQHALVNRHQFSYAQSAQRVVARSKTTLPARPNRRALVIFRDGDDATPLAFRAAHNTQLPGGRLEARAAINGFKAQGYAVDTLLGLQATKEAVLQRLADSVGYDVVWVVAHGDYNPNSQHSSIMLSESDSITEEDILLNCRRTNIGLVVLSACRSAQGRSQAGEGTAGIANILLRTGTQQVVSGLWSLHDDSSYKIMKDYISNVSIQNKENLQITQKSYLERGATKTRMEPYYWAAYVSFL